MLSLKIKSLLILRLAELRIDELYLSGREGAAAQLTEMWENRIDGDPLTKLVPGCFRAKLREILLGEFCTPENFLIHLDFDIYISNYDPFVMIVQSYKKIMRKANENSL